MVRKDSPTITMGTGSLYLIGQVLAHLDGAAHQTSAQ